MLSHHSFRTIHASKACKSVERPGRPRNGDADEVRVTENEENYKQRQGVGGEKWA